MTNYSVWGWLDCLLRYGYVENVAALTAGEASSAIFSPLFDKLGEMGEMGAFPANMATIDYFEAKNLFTTGQAAIFTSGQWDAAEIGTALGDDVGFWWGMQFSDSEYAQNINNQFGNAPFVVSASVGEDAAKKDAVYRFLAFYFGEEGSAILYENSNMPATNYEDLEFTNDNPAFAEIAAALANGNTSITAANPVATLSPTINEPFYDALNSLMLNNITTEEAVEIIDAAIAGGSDVSIPARKAPASAQAAAQAGARAPVATHTGRPALFSPPARGGDAYQDREGVSTCGLA